MILKASSRNDDTVVCGPLFHVIKIGTIIFFRFSVERQRSIWRSAVRPREFWIFQTLYTENRFTTRRLHGLSITNMDLRASDGFVARLRIAWFSRDINSWTWTRRLRRTRACDPRAMPSWGGREVLKERKKKKWNRFHRQSTPAN